MKIFQIWDIIRRKATKKMPFETHESSNYFNFLTFFLIILIFVMMFGVFAMFPAIWSTNRTTNEHFYRTKVQLNFLTGWTILKLDWFQILTTLHLLSWLRHLLEGWYPLKNESHGYDRIWVSFQIISLITTISVRLHRQGRNERTAREGNIMLCED